MRGFLTALLVTSLAIAVACTFAAGPERAARDTPAEAAVQKVDPDQHHRKTGELLVQGSIIRIHWLGLETNEDFKPVVEQLVSEFGDDGHNVGTLRPDVNNPREDQKPRDEFERKLIARWTAKKKTSRFVSA